MKFVEQRSDDDCLRAALASVLDLAYEDVPENVRAGDEQHNRMQAFLSGRGLVAWTFGLHGVTDPQVTARALRIAEEQDFAVAQFAARRRVRHR